MNSHEFEMQLKAEGFTEIETKSIAPRPANDAHGHPYKVKGLVLSGAFTVIQNSKPTTYRPGEVFEVDAGCAHSEVVDKEGTQILVGRKY